jgi:hypothetical protein
MDATGLTVSPNEKLAVGRNKNFKVTSTKGG